MHYRVEIDGLRALAIIPVVLFHAGLTAISGGFLGVDIFFVISGYLITSILIKELQSDSFSIINFYERRARRILPALMLVLTFTTFFSFILLSPKELKDFSQSVVSVVTFSSNIYFYLTSGYFSTQSEEIPLLHTWSLAVEEQFYVFFPLIMLLCYKIGKKSLLWLVSFITIVSFLSTLWLVERNSSANFYLITSRAWELLAGALIAIYYSKLVRIKLNHREWLSFLGLSLLILSLFIINKTDKHPGIITLIPVLGVCLIIAFSSKTKTASFLSNKVFVRIGVISYSLYLWHQPVFAFVHIKMNNEFSFSLVLFLLILTYLLSSFSYRYVENPFRNKVKYSQKKIFIYSFFSLFLFALMGLYGHFDDGIHERYSTQLDTKSIQISPYRYKCHSSQNNYVPPSQACKLGSGETSWAILGDSHGVELSFALHQRLKDSDNSVLQLTYSECSPALTYKTSVIGCSEWLDKAVNYIENQSDIENVIVAYRHAYYLYGDQLYNLKKDLVTSNTLKIGSKNDTTIAQQKAREQYWHSFSALIARFQKAHKNIYILYPVPELNENINKLVFPFSIFHSFSKNLNQAVSIDYYKQRNKSIITKLDQLADKYKAQKIQPQNILCGKAYCTVVHGKEILYFDDDHLSVAGAQYILNDLKLKY